MAEMIEYTYVCIKDLPCDGVDVHSLRCRGINDTERRDHYRDEAAIAAGFLPRLDGSVEVVDGLDEKGEEWSDEPIPYSIVEEAHLPLPCPFCKRTHAIEAECAVTAPHHPSCPVRQGKSGDCVCPVR